MNAKEIWQCQGCYASHYTFSAAMECCEPEKFYECSECHDTHSDKHEAEICCAQEEEDFVETPEQRWKRKYDENEAAGQQRLF